MAMSGVSERWRNGYLSENLRTATAEPRRAARTRASGHARAELRHVAPRLPHQPYGRPLRSCNDAQQSAGEPRRAVCNARAFAARDAQQQRLLSCRLGTRAPLRTPGAGAARTPWQHLKCTASLALHLVQRHHASRRPSSWCGPVATRSLAWEGWWWMTLIQLVEERMMERI